MDNGDIDRFLAQLTPAQETVVLMRDIKSLLERLLDREEQSTFEGDLKDLLIKNTPTATPFIKQQSARKPK